MDTQQAISQLEEKIESIQVYNYGDFKRLAGTYIYQFLDSQPEENEKAQRLAWDLRQIIVYNPDLKDLDIDRAKDLARRQIHTYL